MKKILLIFFFGLFARTALAQSTDFYDFADSAIDIFSDIRNAELPQDSQANNDEKALLESALKNSVRKNQIYARAMYRLKEFNKPGHEGIQQAVKFLTSGIFLLQSANNNFGSYMEQLLNDPKLLTQQGTVSRKIAELSEASNSAWQAYVQTAGVVTYSLIDGPTSLKDIDPKKMQQKLSKLLITKSEIDLLKTHLQKSFGPVLADNSKAGLVDIPAMSMWRFLNDKWIPATE